jgi:hypothetical protein
VLQIFLLTERQNFRKVRNTKLPFPMIQSLLICKSVLTTVTLMINLPFGGISMRVCPMGVPISEMDSITLPR